MRRTTCGAPSGAWRAGILALTVLVASTAAAPLDAQNATAQGGDRAPASVAPTAATSAQDAAAIKDVVAKYVAAREVNDVAAVTALFTADADQLVSSGEWRRGRDALVSGAMASSQRSAGKRTVTIETIRAIAPGVALADGRYEIAASPGNPARLMWSSFVLVKGTEGGVAEGTPPATAGRWRIAAIRNMLPAPPPPAAAGNR